jgi:hypothetical protein
MERARFARVGSTVFVDVLDESGMTDRFDVRAPVPGAMPLSGEKG